MGAPKLPPPPSLPPPPLAANPMTLGSSQSALAGALEKQRSSAAEGKGMDHTILTSPQGATTPNTAKVQIK